MALWSVPAFLLSTAAVFLIANVSAFLALLRTDRALARVLAALKHRPGALYPAVLLAHSHGRRDTAVTGWAAVHRARRLLPDAEGDHQLTSIAQGALARNSGLEDITEVTGEKDFYGGHMAEAAWLMDQLPGRPDSRDLRAKLVAFPAAAISGWMGFYVCAYWTARLKADRVGFDEPYSEEATAPYGGAILFGLAVWVAGFLVMLAVQALMWLRVHSRWQRRVRGRGAQVARRELGDSYDAFLADLSREKFALLRPPIASSAVPGPQDLTR